MRRKLDKSVADLEKMSKCGSTTAIKRKKKKV
jgi:hypothetical protein